MTAHESTNYLWITEPKALEGVPGAYYVIISKIDGKEVYRKWFADNYAVKEKEQAIQQELFSNSSLTATV